MRRCRAGARRLTEERDDVREAHKRAVTFIFGGAGPLPVL